MNRPLQTPYSRQRCLLINEFKPRSYHEEQILDIARAIGEKSVAYLKSVYDRYDKDFYVIPIAYRRLQERIAAGEKITNKPAYFNRLVRNLINERKGGDKE